MTTQYDKLLQLATEKDAEAAELHRQAEALRYAAAMLNGHARSQAATRGVEKQLTAAIALRKKQPTPTPRHDALRDRREFLVEFLDRRKTYTTIELEHVLKQEDLGASRKTLYGDLQSLGWRNSGNGPGAHWGATARAHHDQPRSKPPHKPSHKPSSGKSYGKSRQQREKTAAVLDRVAASATPVPPGEIPGISILAAHGYLRKEEGGYVRTEKPFTV